MTIETHNTNPVKTTKPRRWFRFRLRTLLIMVMLLSVPLGWVGWELDQRQREKAVVAWVEELGGEVHFYSNPDRSWWERTKDKWLGVRVAIVTLIGCTHVSDLSPLAELKSLKYLYIWDTQVGDLSPLADLNNLIGLDLRRTNVSDEQVEKLRPAHPNCEIRLTD